MHCCPLALQIEKNMISSFVVFSISVRRRGPKRCFHEQRRFAGLGGPGVALGHLWAPRVSFMSFLDLL